MNIMKQKKKNKKQNVTQLSFSLTYYLLCVFTTVSLPDQFLERKEKDLKGPNSLGCKNKRLGAQFWKGDD